MKKEIRDNIVYVILEESITSANAPQFDAFVSDVPGDYNGIIVDAEKLDYIASSGLRVILTLKKRCMNKTFKVINVSPEVKEIFDVTGFSDIMDIELRQRKISVEGCTIIGAGACGECYRIDDETIIKLYYSHIKPEEIEREKALAKKAFVLGIPTAISYDIVDCDGRKGVIYELIKSKTIRELITNNPENIDHYIDMYVDVCKKIHEIDVDITTLPSFKDIAKLGIPKIQNITDEERNLLYQFLDLVPVEAHCNHGDLNINNIMTQGEECVLIDMGELGYGTTMYDISRIMYSMYFFPLGSNLNPDDTYDFYHLPKKTVDYVYDQFMTKYFGTKDYDTLIKTNEKYRWLLPLAWFRTVCAMHRTNKFTKAHYEVADKLLHEDLIPFIKQELNK